MYLSSSSNSSLLLFLLRAVLSASAAPQTCYYPNGAVASDQAPCSDAEFSACCNTDAICLSNNLCMGIKQPFVLGRGACTDPNWTSENCPQQCQSGIYLPVPHSRALYLSSVSDQPQSGCSIILLNSTDGVNSYCCNSLVVSPGHAQPVCDFGSPFTLPDATPVQGRGALAAVVSTNSSSSTSDGSPSTASPTSPGSPTSSEASSTSSSTAISPACNLSNATALVTDRTQSYRNAAIGAGVSVPLGTVAVGLLLWAMWERRKRRKVEQDIALARSWDAAAAKDSTTSSTQWQNPPPGSYHPQRQSQIREMHHGREPAELL